MASQGKAAARVSRSSITAMAAARGRTFGYPQIKRGALWVAEDPSLPVFVFPTQEHGAYTNAHDPHRRTVNYEDSWKKRYWAKRAAEMRAKMVPGIAGKNRLGDIFGPLGRTP